MKRLLLFTIGFLIFVVATFTMYSRPYIKQIIWHEQPTEITLYKDFYVGLPYLLLGSLLMFLSFLVPSLQKRFSAKASRSI
jgi:hypothetical protein